MSNDGPKPRKDSLEAAFLGLQPELYTIAVLEPKERETLIEDIASRVIEKLRSLTTLNHLP